MAAFPGQALAISFIPLTAAQWLANSSRVLLPYEMAYETDTKQFKMGPGAWSGIQYTGGGNQVITPTQTIATTGNSDVSIVAPITGRLIGANFIGNDVLATSDTNYITWTITNLSNASAAMLATSPAGVNTTKVTGGAAIAANTTKALTLTGTAASLLVTLGDRILVRAAASGTLANTVTLSQYLLNFG